MCQTTKTPVDLGELLSPTSQPGIYVRSGRFHDVVQALQRGFFDLWGGRESFAFRSSGFLPREDLARSSYLEKFPQFVARVVPELDEGAGAPLVTLPSACLSLYPVLASKERVPQAGLLTTVASPCFRNEAGYGPERMRSFHMAEYVFFGDAEQTRVFREETLERLRAWLAELGVSPRVANASDPFFGRMGEILAERQKAANLKLEILLKIADETEIAAFSINDHKEFFCLRWDIELASGARGESSCVGVGLERLALAMFHAHGGEPDAWPQAFQALR